MTLNLSKPCAPDPHVRRKGEDCEGSLKRLGTDSCFHLVAPFFFLPKNYLSRANNRETSSCEPCLTFHPRQTGFCFIRCERPSVGRAELEVLRRGMAQLNPSRTTSMCTKPTGLRGIRRRLTGVRASRPWAAKREEKGLPSAPFSLQC